MWCRFFERNPLSEEHVWLESFSQAPYMAPGEIPDSTRYLGALLEVTRHFSPAFEGRESAFLFLGHMS